MKEIITSIYSIYSHRHVQAEEIEPALCNETPKFHRLFLYIFVLTSEPKLTHFEFYFLKIDPSPLALQFFFLCEITDLENFVLLPCTKNKMDNRSCALATTQREISCGWMHLVLRSTETLHFLHSGDFFFAPLCTFSAPIYVRNVFFKRSWC